MSEKLIPTIEKTDIVPPALNSGGTAIVLQRHERYERDRAAELSGSLFPDPEQITLHNDRNFFEEMLEQEAADGKEVYVLLVSSDTQYNNKGFRSVETGDIALQAAQGVFSDHGIEPEERIINLNPSFHTREHHPTGSVIRPIKSLQEPRIFDKPEYLEHLRDKFGAADAEGNGLSQAAWAAHEADTEEEAREQFGAESVHDILARTKKSIKVFERYSRAFHAANPDKRLVIWATTHYDTISPLVKEATGTTFHDYIPVDYGGGVVISLDPETDNPQLRTRNQSVPLHMGRTALHEP